MKTIGIVGGGQLGRMLTLAAKPLGFHVIVIDPNPNCPAAQAGAEEITANLYDEAALNKLAKQADFITVEIEHLDAKALEKIQSHGKPVNPSPQTIRLIQDKLAQKQSLAKAGIPVAPFQDIKGHEHAVSALHSFGGKMLLKTRHGAFDGRGNMVIASADDLGAALQKFQNSALYAESFIPFKKELAVVVARDMQGNIVIYPVVETVHKRNICVEVAAPAAISKSEEQQALKLARAVANHLDGAGVFAIEMFLTKDGKVLVNEIAPRVHNSGHFSIEACRTSQFEQHIRAISGLPLGKPDMIVPAAVMINILGERDGPTQVDGLDKALSLPHTSVHLYGKSPTKVDRKMGHITTTAGTIELAKRRARQARRHLKI